MWSVLPTRIVAQSCVLNSRRRLTILRPLAAALSLATLYLTLLISGPVAAQDDRLLFRGSTVVTGFSGTFEPFGQGGLPPGSNLIDETFIDLAGASAKVYLPDQPGYVWDGRLWNLPAYDRVEAQDVGQVFGIAIDHGWPIDANGTAAPPNAYITATSAYGLHIVVPDADGDGLPERVFIGQAGARFMEGQFGTLAGFGNAAGQFSNPGSVYKIDGTTRQISLLTNLTLFGEENSGPGLGNIAFDAQHHQLFVSDRDTGLIHRLDLDGNDLEQFDHGTTGRPNEGLPAAPFDPSNRLEVTSFDFDAEDASTWAYAAADRRTWGLAVHNGRLYYAVADGPQIWSVGIDNVAGFLLADARWELDVWPEGPGFEVSDIVFNGQGAMLLAQRGTHAGSYDYEQFMKPRRARVYRYWLESPDDPATDSRWHFRPEEYAIGFQPNHRDTSGGVDLNYGYTDAGVMDYGNCQGTLWTTGDKLRTNPVLSAELFAGGELMVHGLQGSPSDQVRSANTPPWSSYFIDYDNLFDDPKAFGHVGDVEAYNPCGGGDIPPPPPPPPPPGGPCIEIETEFQCNRQTGEMEVIVTVDEGGSGLMADFLKVLSQNPGVSIVGGPFHSLNPAEFSVIGGAPSQTITLTLCAFNSAEAASGKPFTCCRAEADIKVPRRGCEGPNGILKLQDN